MTTTRLVEVDRCQLCGSNSHAELFAEPPHTVLRCKDCGLVYVTPRLDEDALRDEVYGETYWRSDRPREHGYSDYSADEQLYLKTFRRRLKLVNRHRPTVGRVLDVGCAAGFFLRVMKDHGWDTWAVEPSAPIAAKAISHLGEDRVWVGTLDDLPAGRPGYEPASFDLVSMWDVVEHVPDPQSLLRQARSLLKPDGLLILETQNVRSAFARLLGKRWHHYKHREHLYHFNPKTLDRLLDQAGLEVVQRTASFGGKYVSLAFIAERAQRLHRAVGTLLSPLNLLRRQNLYVNLRDEMVVVAKPAD